MMSSIFVPELAVEKAKNKFPAVFEKALTRFKHLRRPELAQEALKAKLEKSDCVLTNIANREEEIWTVWANLCKASRV